jgi:hypothetical protein
MPNKKIHITETLFGHREGTQDETYNPFWIGFTKGYNSGRFFEMERNASLVLVGDLNNNLRGTLYTFF